MADPETLAKLIAELEQAEGPDREIDAAIFCALDDRYYLSKTQFGSTIIMLEGFRWGLDEIVPTYTGSIDAAVALVEEVLNKWSLHVNTSEGLGYPVVSLGRSHPTNKTIHAEHKTIPLAICLAALRALQAQQKEVA